MGHESLCCLQEHRSTPSIGIYTVFNEGWGQFDTQRLVQEAKALDPSRLWDAASGWIDPQDRTAYPPGGETSTSPALGCTTISAM